MKWLLVVWYITNAGTTGSAALAEFKTESDCNAYRAVAMDVYTARFARVLGTCRAKAEPST